MRFVKIVSSIYESLQLRNNSLSQKMKQVLLMSKLIVLLMKIVNIRLHTQLGAETVKILLSFCGHRVQLRSKYMQRPACVTKRQSMCDHEAFKGRPNFMTAITGNSFVVILTYQLFTAILVAALSPTYVFIHYIFHTCHTSAGNVIINTYFINIAASSNDSWRHGLVNAHTQL